MFTKPVIEFHRKKLVEGPSRCEGLSASSKLFYLKMNTMQNLITGNCESQSMGFVTFQRL